MRGPGGGRGEPGLGARRRALGRGPPRGVRAAVPVDRRAGNPAGRSGLRRRQPDLLGGPEAGGPGATGGPEHARAPLRSVRSSDRRDRRVAPRSARGIRLSPHVRQLRKIRAEPARQALGVATPRGAPGPGPRVAERGPGPRPGRGRSPAGGDLAAAGRVGGGRAPPGEDVHQAALPLLVGPGADRRQRLPGSRRVRARRGPASSGGEVSGSLRERLWAIKRGEVPLPEVLAEAEGLSHVLERARDTSNLRPQPDFAAADVLLRRVAEEIARRHVQQLPGPLGRDAPAPPRPSMEGEG